MSDLLELGKYALGGGGSAAFVAGIIFGVKYLRNGRAKTKLPPNCPAAPILEAHKDVLLRQTEAFNGFSEAVNRNTAQSERVNDTLIQVLLKEKSDE